MNKENYFGIVAYYDNPGNNKIILNGKFTDENNKTIVKNGNRYNIKSSLRESDLVTISIGLSDFKQDFTFYSFIDKLNDKESIKKRIDDINILQATFEAMRGAVDELERKPDFVLIDGDKSPGLDIPHKTVVKGDSKSMAIAAASILAKVSRDRYIVKMGEKYPGYGFHKHKGYGTKAHYEAIAELGISPIHRKSFLRKLFN